jgi:F-type H+-transporting ATPase subunit b
MFDAPFWALVGLIVFLGIVVYMKVPRQITGSLDSRAAAIRKELDEAQRLRKEAEALLAEYKQKAASAEAEAGQIVEQAKREAIALAGEARKRTEEYVASRTKLAEEKIAQAEAQAVQEVRSLSADVAVAAAEKLLAARIKGAEGEALIAKSIGDIRSKLN